MHIDPKEELIDAKDSIRENQYSWHPASGSLWICVSDAFFIPENVEQEIFKALESHPLIDRVLTGDEWGIPDSVGDLEEMILNSDKWPVDENLDSIPRDVMQKILKADVFYEEPNYDTTPGKNIPLLNWEDVYHGTKTSLKINEIETIFESVLNQEINKL